MDTNSTHIDQVNTSAAPNSSEVPKLPSLITSEAEEILTSTQIEETTLENILEESQRNDDNQSGGINFKTEVAKIGESRDKNNSEDRLYAPPSIDIPQSHQPLPETVKKDVKTYDGELLKKHENEEKFHIDESIKEIDRGSSIESTSQKIIEAFTEKNVIAPTVKSISAKEVEEPKSQNNTATKPGLLVHPISSPLSSPSLLSSSQPHPTSKPSPFSSTSKPSTSSSTSQPNSSPSHLQPNSSFSPSQPFLSSSPSSSQPNSPPSSSQPTSSSSPSQPTSSSSPSQPTSPTSRSQPTVSSSSSPTSLPPLSLPSHPSSLSHSSSLSPLPTLPQTTLKRNRMLPVFHETKITTPATESNITQTDFLYKSTISTTPPRLLNASLSSTAEEYVQVHPQISIKSPVLAIVLPSIFGVLLLCILIAILFIVYRRHKFLENYEEKCRDIEKEIYNQVVEINDVYSLPADNISTKSLYSEIENHRRDSPFDESTTELLPDESPNIYDQIQHSPPIYQNVAMPFGSVSSGHATTLVDNDMYEHAGEVVDGGSGGNTATRHLPPLLIRRPSQRNQPRTRINPDYDPVYVPHSDASAMERRLDRSGYVQTTRMRSNQCMYEDLPIFTQLVNGCLAYPGPVPQTNIDMNRADRYLEEQVPVLEDEDMLENEEIHLLHDHHHVYSSVSPPEGSDHDDHSPDSETASEGGSDSTFEALYHDVNDDIRDQIYESVTFD